MFNFLQMVIILLECTSINLLGTCFDFCCVLLPWSERTVILVTMVVSVLRIRVHVSLVEIEELILTFVFDPYANLLFPPGILKLRHPSLGCLHRMSW